MSSLPTPASPIHPAEGDWHRRSTETLLAELHASPAGLAPDEAGRRLLADGPNRLEHGARVRPWRILLAQFQGVIVWILIGASALSGVLGDAVDACTLLAVVVLNAGIGFHQEYKAGRSIEALEVASEPQATVVREGTSRAIPAAEVVAGDILVLEAGDLVAADGRLLEASGLRCIESALTGESEAVRKGLSLLDRDEVSLGDRENMVFKGTSIGAGAGRALVVATGMRTELGRIAGLIDQAAGDGSTPLQRRIESLGRLLVWVALGVVGLLFLLGLLRGNPPLELFLTAVSLAVAAVPEGLPAIVTVALSLGVVRMARRRALIRRLAAVETLGSTSVICTDKTGTLTVGEMTVRSLRVGGVSYQVTGEGYGPAGEVHPEGKAAERNLPPDVLELAEILVGCNRAEISRKDGVWAVLGDPTEGALRVAGTKAGADRDRLDRESPAMLEFPFDSDRKRASVLRRGPAGRLRLQVNGAPGILLGHCDRFLAPEGVRPLTEADRTAILAAVGVMAARGLRVLASATREMEEPVPDEPSADLLERDLVFVGLTGLHDPPRPEARAALAQCRSAGIRVVMITGDHPATAVAIAREIGLLEGTAVAITGAGLDRLSEDQLRDQLPGIAVYARVTASHKLRIVRAWKAAGAVVAMTGDGVNDAPAIAGADIGIAMGRTGTEVTRQAADMVLTDDNFATIIAAVEEGRGIYGNIRHALQYLLAGSAGEILLMAVCVVVGMPAPLLPIHLLWINLVTDGLPALCLATDTIDPAVMKSGPCPRLERLAYRGFLKTVALTGSITAAVSFGVYAWYLRSGSVETARSAAFAVLVFSELFRAFGARSESRLLWQIVPRLNLPLVAVVVVSAGIQVLSQNNAFLGRLLKTAPFPFLDSVALLALGTVPLLFLEVLKAIRVRHARASSPV